LEDQGSHEELLRRSPTYRRIFALAEPATREEEEGTRISADATD